MKLYTRIGQDGLLARIGELPGAVAAEDAVRLAGASVRLQITATRSTEWPWCVRLEPEAPYFLYPDSTALAQTIQVYLLRWNDTTDEMAVVVHEAYASLRVNGRSTQDVWVLVCGQLAKFLEDDQRDQVALRALSVGPASMAARALVMERARAGGANFLHLSLQPANGDPGSSIPGIWPEAWLAAPGGTLFLWSGGGLAGIRIVVKQPHRDRTVIAVDVVELAEPLVSTESAKAIYRSAMSELARDLIEHIRAELGAQPEEATGLPIPERSKEVMQLDLWRWVYWRMRHGRTQDAVLAELGTRGEQGIPNGTMLSWRTRLKDSGVTDAALHEWDDDGPPPNFDVEQTVRWLELKQKPSKKRAKKRNL